MVHNTDAALDHGACTLLHARQVRHQCEGKATSIFVCVLLAQSLNRICAPLPSDLPASQSVNLSKMPHLAAIPFHISDRGILPLVDSLIPPPPCHFPSQHLL